MAVLGARVAGLALCLLLLFSVQALHAQNDAGDRQRFERLFVFGDSLSDTGNVDALTGGLIPATSPPYFEGRFSNGPLWVEALAAFLSIDLKVDQTVNLDPLAPVQAFGGALSGNLNVNGVFDPAVAETGLLSQVRAFRDAGGSFGRRDLVVVWAGANDYLFDLDVDPQHVVDNITQAVRELAALGARSFVVPNLPDLGDTPFALDLGLQVPLNSLTFVHNELLAAAMTKTRRALRVKVLLLDVNRAFAGIDQLFDNVVVPCMIQDPPNPPELTGFCPLDENGIPNSTILGGTLYADVVHPTTQAHDLLGAFAFGAVIQAFEKGKRKRWLKQLH